MIRRAQPEDVPAIVDLAVEAVSRQRWPVKLDREAMTASARLLASHPASFLWVGEHDGKVQACVAAETSPGFWFHGMQSTVLMFYTRKPGLGLALLRQYAAWVRTRPAIKLAVFGLEPDIEGGERITRLLARLGFTHSAPQCMYVRGMP